MSNFNERWYIICDVRVIACTQKMVVADDTSMTNVHVINDTYVHDNKFLHALVSSGMVCKWIITRDSHFD